MSIMRIRAGHFYDQVRRGEFRQVIHNCSDGRRGLTVVAVIVSFAALGSLPVGGGDPQGTFCPTNRIRRSHSDSDNRPRYYLLAFVQRVE
jgi:hypothetical protein